MEDIFGGFYATTIPLHILPQPQAGRRRAIQLLKCLLARSSAGADRLYESRSGVGCGVHTKVQIAKEMYPLEYRKNVIEGKCKENEGFLEERFG